jgi:cbb3-type cytochrome oxidase subunit 3
MTIEHDFLVGFSKSFGLFYLLAFSVGVHSILHDEDRPYEDKSWR